MSKAQKGNEDPLSFLYPLSLKIYDLLDKKGLSGIFGSRESYERLETNKDAEQARRKAACKSIAYVIVILIGTALLTVACIIGNRQTIPTDGRLPRNDVGEGSREYSLVVSEDGGNSEKVTFSVSERECSPDELEDYFDEAFSKLETLVLGDGVSADCVEGDLNLISQIPGTIIEVSWPELDYNYVFSTGAVRHDMLTEPTIISMTARLKYLDEVRIYSFPVRLMPIKEQERTFSDKVIETLESEDKDSRGTKWFTLPGQIDGRNVSWGNDRYAGYLIPLICGIAAAVAVIPAMKTELKKKEKLREEEMLRDYPDIISKFVLLVNAGMTIRGAWEKICGDYVKTQKKKRYAYEEMLRSMHELRFGMTEAAVYEGFGSRAKVPEYRRFGTLLANNLRRGSRDLTDLLNIEAREAFAQRRASVERKAEEAGTKLLFPMLGMLCLVLAIVVVPAFSAFGG